MNEYDDDEYTGAIGDLADAIETLIEMDGVDARAEVDSIIGDRA